MHIAIQSSGFILTDSLRAYVHQRLQSSLGWVMTRRLAVWLSDINGPRGGRDKRCKIQISLDNGKSVVIEDTEDDLYAAIDRAAERADRAVSRQLARRRAFPHEKINMAQEDATPDDGAREDLALEELTHEEPTPEDLGRDALPQEDLPRRRAPRV